MDNSFQDILIDYFSRFQQRVVIVKNVDGFLENPEVISLLDLNNIIVFKGSNLAFRVVYELEVKTREDEESKVIFINNRPESILEDISNQANQCSFSLQEFFPEYHLATLLECHLDLLDFLYANKPLRSLDTRGTLKFILEHHYGIDADNFSSKELVLSKWLDFYQQDKPVDRHIVAFFRELSTPMIDLDIVKSKAQLIQYLQGEWGKCAEGITPDIDFNHQTLQNFLSSYFFKGWLKPSEDISGNCQDIGIPYAVEPKRKSYTKEDLVKPLKGLLSHGDLEDWHDIALTTSQAILNSLSVDEYEELSSFIHEINNRFQIHLEANYRQHIQPSNPYKRPKVVSKVLDHLKGQFAITDKVALIVIDGMAFWQYILLKDGLKNDLSFEEHTIYSWIPSITYLSRQAIFRGSSPDTNYIQNPENEKKLWEDYWTTNGVPSNMIRYDYQNLETNGIQNLSRLAVVFSDLDEKMHSSSDFQDLYGLTKNWIIRSEITNQVRYLINNQYTVFLTTDHGNIQATGWRNLKGKEKFGTRKSRSRRHLEYAEDWLADEFLANNPDLAPAIGRELNTLFLRNESSFSNKDTEVTHGGSHFLEVLVPFVKIFK